jgi:hypothetical protein
MRSKRKHTSDKEQKEDPPVAAAAASGASQPSQHQQKQIPHAANAEEPAATAADESTATKKPSKSVDLRKQYSAVKPTPAREKHAATEWMEDIVSPTPNADIQDKS